MGFKHFVFDLDGTLIDTEKAVLNTWVQTLREYGYDFTLEDARVVLGVTTEIGLERLKAVVDDDYTTRWQKNYARYADEAEFFDGACKMLAKLKDKGCVLGIVSSRSRNEYDAFFSKFDLNQYFDIVVLEEDTLKHKPNPEPLKKYLELAGANKEECIYIGDMPGDICCANAAGITSGLAKWNGSDVVCNDADLIFNNMGEVIGL